MNLPDPRTFGSKNPGATNVLRTGNKIAALITLIGDSLKGFIPVVIIMGIVEGEVSLITNIATAYFSSFFILIKSDERLSSITKFSYALIAIGPVASLFTNW